MLAALMYVLGINALGFGAMAVDKRKAAQGRRRVPESTLLMIARLGGSIGTVLAQRVVLHKTRKEPFRTRLLLIVAIQLVVLAVIAIATVVAGSPDPFMRMLPH